MKNKKVWTISEHTNKTSTSIDVFQKDPELKKAGTWGVRHFIIGQLFVAVSVAYALRVNLSVGIVAMTDKHNANPDFEEFEWDEKIKGMLLSSFFWGYIITQVPAGQLGQRYGPKIILFYAMLFVSLLTLLTPLAATMGGWKFVCALRLLEGLCQGVLFPSCHTLLSKWAPLNERGQLGTYMYCGAQFGTVAILSSSGILASSALGWPSLFYIPATIGVAWSIVWFFYGSNSPNEYKTISPEEKSFIVTSLGSSSVDMKIHRLPTPWRGILTSMPCYALIIVHSTHNWGFWTLLTEMPSYMKNILELDIKQNALLSSLPYLTMLFMSFFFSFLAGTLTKRNCVPLKYSRKLFNSIGHWLPMIALFALGYVSKDQVGVAVLLLTLAVGISAATYLGFQINHIDLTPNFAGPLMGITNCAANITGIVAPLAVGFIVNNEKDPVQWRIVFFLAAGVYFIGNLIFVIFSKTDVQPWNEPNWTPNSRKKSVDLQISNRDDAEHQE